MAPVAGTGAQGFPRVPQQKDVRTRRALRRFAGTNATGGTSPGFTTHTTFATKPAPGNVGNLAFFTDVNIFGRDNGTIWEYFGPSLSGLTLPVAADYSNLNFTGSAAIDYSTGVAVFTNFGRGDGSNKLNGQIKPLPFSVPYGIFMQQSSNLPAAGGSTNALAGIVGYDSNSGKAFMWGNTWRGDLGDSIEVYYMNTVNTVTTEPYKFTAPASVAGGEPWFGFQNDGVNWKFLIGNPDGNRFAIAFEDVVNANGTLTHLGFGINACGPTTFQVSQTVYSIAYTNTA